MDNAGAANFGSGTPVAALLKNIGGLSFSMMMPILAGYIAMSIGERPALMPGIVGGFLATTGGSGFFGALFAGFIAGYLVLLLKKVLSVLPESLEAPSPSCLPGFRSDSHRPHHDLCHQSSDGYLQYLVV